LNYYFEASFNAKMEQGLGVFFDREAAVKTISNCDEGSLRSLATGALCGKVI
jgi:hypothetical protein